MTRCSFLLLLLIASIASAQVQPTPKLAGELKGPWVWKSKIYPGTERNYWVYVPVGYDPAKPACIMVVQDGLSRAEGWHLPATMDSLIKAGRMPVTIGIFVDHGKVPSSNKEIENYPRYNRSLEYDGLGDRYARFLLEELLPEVARSYNLSTNPDDRSIAGASSGAICAFNVAWERPDQFRRVLSTIGTYVGLRGGDEFATLVRKTEPKPLRVFLEDGNHDLNIYAGDWWTANQAMLSALTWNGYEVNHAWGEGGHDSKHALTILPEALAWLWKDYPAPVKTHKGTALRVNPTLEGESWKPVVLKVSPQALAVNKAGKLFFTDNERIYALDGETDSKAFVDFKGKPGGIAFHSDGVMYAGDLQRNKLVAIDEAGTFRDIASNVHAGFITVSAKGIYFSGTADERVGFYSFATRQVVYSKVPGGPTGLSISAEQTFLNVAVAQAVFGYSFRINTDGTLESGQDYVHYHLPYGASIPGAGGMTVDTDNLLYTATSLGVQVSDQLGRVNFIFSNAGDTPVDVKFGGPDFNTLYVAAGGKLFSRKVTAKGVLSCLPPVKPPKPGM